MTHCSFCRGPLWHYPSIGNAPAYVACLHCAWSSDTRIPTIEDQLALRQRAKLPVLRQAQDERPRRVEAGDGS